MKWTHATSLLATVGLMGAGGVWAGCSNNNGNGDGGSDSGGNDVNQQQDTGGNDTGVADTGSDAGQGVDATVLDCNYYCDNIIAACTGTNQQYLNKATCLEMCAAIPDDASAVATAGNSLACHMYHLSVAATSSANAAIHCPHAGPYGYGMCGGLCEDFCHQYFGGPCATDTTNGYASEAACNTYCATAPGEDASAGAPGAAQTTPTMLCKEYHLENAFMLDGGSGHCDHAGMNGGNGVCP